MAKGRQIRSFDYVNRPYDEVVEAMTNDTDEVFQSASRTANSRAKTLAAELHVKVAGFEISRDVSINVNRVVDRDKRVQSMPKTWIELEWKATDAPGMFPIMNAELAIYPLSDTETQLDLSGNYQPPLGIFGNAVDALVGHRIAEASVQRFVSDLASRLGSSTEDQAEQHSIS